MIVFRRRRRWILELIVSTRKYLSRTPSALRPPLRDAALARGLENWRLSFRRGEKARDARRGAHFFAASKLGPGNMGVVTRGMGGTGSVARAGAVSLGVARAPGVELAVELERRASFSTPARVGGRAVLGTAGGMDAAAAAGKRKALDHSSRVEKNKKTCRRASDAPQTDVADIPVRPRAPPDPASSSSSSFFSPHPFLAFSRMALWRRTSTDATPASSPASRAGRRARGCLRASRSHFIAEGVFQRHAHVRATPSASTFFHPALELRRTCGSRGLLTRHRPVPSSRDIPRERHPRD